MAKLTPDEENDSLFSSIGIDLSFLRKVKFGGIVGKVALIAIVGTVMLGAIAVVMVLRGVDPTIIAYLLVAVVVMAMIGIIGYGAKFPKQATLEGMEVIAFENQRLALDKFQENKIIGEGQVSLDDEQGRTSIPSSSQAQDAESP